MFILHTSNRTENLLAHLTTVIETAPLSTPFAKETFLIQSQGMERWLAQQLATHFKVWSHYEFLFPGKFFSGMALQVDSNLNDQLFARETMVWRIEALLRDLQGDAYRPLLSYLSSSNSALKRFQLARQLAQVFDQYQILRPDMLLEWQQGRSVYSESNETWQRLLWQQLVAEAGEYHRGSLYLLAIEKLRGETEGSFVTQLPERVHVFGLSTMPPLFLAFLQALARHSDVHFYLLNPAQTYWADLQNKRQLSRQQQTQDDSTFGHPLLAVLGQQGREFQEMLLETAEFEVQVDSFAAAETQQRSNLQQLQDDILNNQLTACQLSRDGSISLHACHSRMREVQVLKNQLLAALEKNQDLQLRDIVIMAPDIQHYEPFISAVFADIQHAIADRSMRLSNVLLELFIRFLHLSQGRFGWQEVLDLLEQPAIYSSFGLSETDLQLLGEWLQALHVRWGQSAQHKAKLGLPPLAENTWRAALDRLLMGYAYADESHFVHGTLPYAAIEGTSAQALGGLNDFLNLLFKAAADFSRAKSLQAWSEQLYQYAMTLFSTTQENAQEQQQLYEILAELAEKFAPVHAHDVELQVLISWLEDALDERKSSTGFLRGQLTFCSMLPMRSIPFKVIALLGVNEGEFPKIDNPPTFDLMGHHFRKGDRSRRSDDRYQFLEILLSVRQQLIITFIGLSIQNNEPKQASVVINEMLDILQNSYQLNDLVTYHSLQAFSEHYFTNECDLFSYNASDCRTAVVLAEKAVATSPWWSAELALETETVIDINELFAFYRHPQKYFLQHKLSLQLSGIETVVEEREPFIIDGLDAYQINQNWINAALAGEDFSLPKLKAQGLWLSGAGGEIEFAKKQQEIQQFVALIEAKELGLSLNELNVDIVIDNFRLLGKLSHHYENGSLFFRYASLKGKDFFIAWLQHLMINQMHSQKTHLLSCDEDLLFIPELAQKQDLSTLLNIYQQGQTNPHVFFVEAAFAYVRQTLALQTSKRAKKPALEAAIEQLQKTLDAGYDAELALSCRGILAAELLSNNAFAEMCQSLVFPVWASLHGME